MARDGDIPFCDICTEREATSIDKGIYRCEYCETAHERLEAAEARLGTAQAHDYDDEGGAPSGPEDGDPADAAPWDDDQAA